MKLGPKSKYGKRALEILGVLAEIDLDFRMGKLDAVAAWYKTHEALEIKKDE